MIKHKNQYNQIKRPPFRKYVMEHFRVWKELLKFRRFKEKYEPEQNGDGHPVLVIPGFMTSDWSTEEYRSFIKKFGYTPYGWGLGRNYGGVSELNLLADKIDYLYEKHGQQISLVGWSLGGVYARQLAKEKPDKIRQVITVCSPFAGVDKPNNAAWLYKLVNIGRKIDEADRKKWTKDIINTPPVPTTALYSKDDGIVPWQVCMEPVEDDLHQNVEINGTHFGLGYKPAVLKITQNRLQYKQDNWEKYPTDKT